MTKRAKLPERWSKNIFGESGARRLHLAGVMAGACVAATAKGALKRGYAVKLLESGIGATNERARVDALERLRKAGCGSSELVERDLKLTVG